MFQINKTKKNRCIFQALPQRLRILQKGFIINIWQHPKCTS